MATRTTTTSSNAQPAPIPGGVPTPRTYKTHLTPFLHRAFLSAALLALGPCYISAIFMSPSTTLWSLNPIGMTGLRTILLFLPVLAVFIIRVMNLHVGKRTTTSMAETLYIQVAASGIKTAATVGWYAFSAWMFGEVYIWSRSRRADLGWVDMGIAGYERPTVNENPILLRSVFVVLAVGQAVLHLARDYDRIAIEETEGRASQVQAEEVSRLPEPIQLLAQQLRPITGKVARLVIPGIVFSIPIYFMFIRRPAWNYLAYPIARVLVRQLPPNNGPTAIMHPLTLLWQALTASTILVVLWELSNAIFTIHVSRPPLKRGQPLTSEVKDASGVVLSRSRDPNGSLIRGLKAKKDVPRAFAFWELYLICTDPHFETRRKSIFADVDRKPLSSWQEISSLCLAEIAAISTRIRVAQEPSASASQQQQQVNSQQQRQMQSAPQFGLPRIARQSVLNDRAVVLPGRGGSARGGAGQALAAVGSAAKSIGQSPTPASGARKGSVAEYSRQAIEYGMNKAGNNTLLSGWQTRAVEFLRTPLGEPFRRTFARTVRAVVLGVPFSNGVDIVHASKSLTALAVISLKEDSFGQAQRDIASIIRVYTSSVLSIRNFIAGLPAHWTDVCFEDGQREVSTTANGNGELDEVRVVLEVLREGLEELMLAFGEYVEGLGLSKAEIRTVRETIGAGGQKRGSEMEKVG
ncbi:hypothetical protein LTR91_008111 [Friedmanniomyces endolithicus]|uniref:Nucleoporin NDC1 n=1 Tax=Friedmanniomyces endolithicus TaxID=329885 RepID=A0AAN6QUT9_9PEZI|nr:hypothetical protein LTR57_005431 [Friedmanniomyces endolithicus]KAK0993049.1 hypothetical protein LTR91_008111 [Friedmanniomyces endolithicus]KAK1044635.1 hypothetical protein LTS16_007204 [Friedmanniomyces endolithicus]